MSSMHRSTLLKLASNAYEMNLDVLNGVLTRDENGRWQINAQELNGWLEQHQGHEIVLILGDLTDEEEIVTRICGTCGRDYTDLECPHCRANRIRLRGHA